MSALLVLAAKQLLRRHVGISGETDTYLCASTTRGTAVLLVYEPLITSLSRTILVWLACARSMAVSRRLLLDGPRCIRLSAFVIVCLSNDAKRHSMCPHVVVLPPCSRPVSPLLSS